MLFPVRYIFMTCCTSHIWSVKQEETEAPLEFNNELTDSSSVYGKVIDSVSTLKPIKELPGLPASALGIISTFLDPKEATKLMTLNKELAEFFPQVTKDREDVRIAKLKFLAKT